jgi:hypothetical protein
MSHVASEGGQAGSGVLALLVVVAVFWISNRRERLKRERALRAKKKAEIQAIVKSRPEDAPLFREVLDELEPKNSKEAPE